MNNNKVASYILYSLLIAGVYYVAGISVRPLILPPSFIAPIWPSAGIAVGVIILWGKKYLPAILLGEAMLSSSFYQLDSFYDQPLLILTYIAMLVSTSIRCLLGAYLVNRHLGRSNNYLTLESVIKLLFYAGVIPTFISSFISIVALASNHMVEDSSILINFTTWWFGDTVGVFLILPIMFLLFKQPRKMWRPRLYKTAIPVLITFSLLLILAYNFKYYESERLKEELNNKIEELTDAVLVQFSNKNPMQDWIPKEKAVTEINHIFSDNISDLIMIKSLDDVHFIIYGNKNDKQQKLYESSNKSDLDQNWSSSKIFKYANQEWNIVAYSTTKFFFNHASWIIWWLLTVGFLFIAILGAGLLVITGTNLMIKDRVIEKTKEINQLLSILKESEHKYKQLIEIQPVIFWRYLLGAKQLDYVSDEATNLLGYNKSELLDVEIVLDKMFHPADRDRVIKEFYLGIQSNKRFSIKYRAQGKNGKMFWFKDYISTKSYDDKTEVVGLKIDITAEQIKENKIFQLAFYDSMTQLPNRIKFIEYLDDAIVQSEINHTFGAILYLDLDRFKILNDSMGHYFGDKLLIEISRRLSSLLSYSDVISRFGSDEFVILLAEQNKFKKELKTYVRAMVEKIQEEINKVFKIDEHNIYSSCSIGISVFPSNSSQVNEVIQQADTAMYFAKSIGKNSYIFFKSKMKKNAEKKLQIEKSLKIALLRQEFEMYYQPIFDENKNFIKYESLLRWNHPEKGIVSPDSFIYIAEETGFIIELSEWVIDNVFSYIHNLNKNNLPVLPISINISLLQFENTGFVAVLQSIRDKYQINSNRVILELTESIGIGDFNSTLKKIHKLKNLGFKLAIDDFGTGYSSLNYLTQMPIDILKLDKEFVAKIGSSERADALVETIVLMAQHLKLEMIVEGVETEQQFEFLKRLGCKQFQGYLVSKAISVSRITQIPI